MQPGPTGSQDYLEHLLEPQYRVEERRDSTEHRAPLNNAKNANENYSTFQKSATIFDQIYGVVDSGQCVYLKGVKFAAKTINDGVNAVFGDIANDNTIKFIIHIAMATLGVAITAPLGTWSIILRIATVSGLYFQSDEGSYEMKKDKKIMFAATGWLVCGASIASVGGSAAAVLYEHAATTAHVVAIAYIANLLDLF
jgi:hypothetical protein